MWRTDVCNSIIKRRSERHVPTSFKEAWLKDIASAIRRSLRYVRVKVAVTSYMIIDAHRILQSGRGMFVTTFIKLCNNTFYNCYEGMSDTTLKTELVSIAYHLLLSVSWHIGTSFVKLQMPLTLVTYTHVKMYFINVSQMFYQHYVQLFGQRNIVCEPLVFVQISYTPCNLLY